MKCVEELSPEALFDLHEIKAVPVFDAPDSPAVAFTFADTETTSATACTYSVTVVSENPYNGVFGYAESPLGLAPDDLKYGAMLYVGYGFDNKQILYLSSWGVSASVGQRFNDNFEWQGNLDIRTYTGGLGTPRDASKPGIDITGSLAMTWGSGKAEEIPHYTLNYMTRSPIYNDLADSITLGQSWNMNMVQPALTRLGYLQVRLDDFYLHYYNDVTMLPKLPPYKSEPDRYWTAGLLLGALNEEDRWELAWQAFTGDFIDRNLRYENDVYRQTADQELLNRSEWFLRYAGVDNLAEVTIGRSTPKCLNLQDYIHLFRNWCTGTKESGFFSYPETDYPRYSVTFDAYLRSTGGAQ